MQYDIEYLTTALIAVLEESQTIRECDWMYSIPSTTLIDQVHARVPMDYAKPRPCAKLSKIKKLKLCDNKKYMSRLDFGSFHDEIMNLGSE